MSLTFSLQALLARHESYMAESERERRTMMASIKKLEHDKEELETSNAKTIAENRSLLGQLEELNDATSDSDAHVKSLTTTLESTHLELQRLTVLAGRTAHLEAQLTQLEEEQARLHHELASSEQENRSAIQRWKRAEGTIGHLQDQIDRIEKESREEHERHMEVLGRMNSQRAVEKELECAAGRLKRAAAAKSLHQDAGTSVVSLFVKDVLQDNANLQMGVVELREMLLGSNAEVESLREQLLLHQSIEDVESRQEYPNLSAELSSVDASTYTKPAESVPELHVHHHYHTAEAPIRKARRKRPALIPSSTSPSSGTSTPRNQRIRDWRTTAIPSSAATILSQTSVTIPPTKRMSTKSSRTLASFAPSSVPSSPPRASSIFDNIDTAFDSSRPTTPGSDMPCGSSPTYAHECAVLRSPKQHDKASMVPNSRLAATKTHTPKVVGSEDPSRTDTDHKSEQHDSYNSDSLADIEDPTFSYGNSAFNSKYARVNPSELVSPLGHETILEEGGDSSDTMESPGLSSMNETAVAPRLQRASSHESVLSISGMDIHTLRPRPSQVFSGRGFSPSTIHSPSSPSASGAMAAPTTAMLSLPKGNQDSGEYTRSLLAQARSASGQKESLGKRVGEWVWGKRGAAPIASAPAKSNRRPIQASMRSPGVNQTGRISGLRPPRPTPSEVEPVQIDKTLLQESLAESIER